MNLAASADRQSKIYFNVKEVAKENNVTIVFSELEDYWSDVSEYDVYSEGPADFVHENGYVPELPLSNNRRKWFKERGFSFHRDGSVSYKKVKM